MGNGRFLLPLKQQFGFPKKSTSPLKKVCNNLLMTVEEILQEVALMLAPTRAFIAGKILEMLDVEEQINLSPE